MGNGDKANEVFRETLTTFQEVLPQDDADANFACSTVHV